MAITEAMKEKFNLEIKKRGYVISNINNKVVKVATQILAGKVMRKYHVDDVPMSVITDVT